MNTVSQICPKYEFWVSVRALNEASYHNSANTIVRFFTDTRRRIQDKQIALENGAATLAQRQIRKHLAIGASHKLANKGTALALSCCPEFKQRVLAQAQESETLTEVQKKILGDFIKTDLPLHPVLLTDLDPYSYVFIKLQARTLLDRALFVHTLGQQYQFTEADFLCIANFVTGALS